MMTCDRTQNMEGPCCMLVDSVTGTAQQIYRLLRELLGAKMTRRYARVDLTCHSLGGLYEYEIALGLPCGGWPAQRSVACCKSLGVKGLEPRDAACFPSARSTDDSRADKEPYTIWSKRRVDMADSFADGLLAS